MDHSWFAKLEDATPKRPRPKPYITNDASLDPQADLVELGRQSTQIAVEDGLLVRRSKGKDSQPALELVVPNMSRIDLLTEAHDQSHRRVEYTFSTLKEAGYCMVAEDEDGRP